MSASLISVAELRESNPDRIIIDTRLRKQYDAGHIPGAIWLRWEEWCEQAPEHAEDILKTPGYWGRLADPVEQAFADRLGQRGVSSEAELVIYSAGPRSKGSDGRVAWMLLYLGAKNVRLLDGAWQDWLQLGGQIETSVQQAGKKRFDLHLQPHRRALLSQWQERITKNQVILIDTRSDPEFAGECFDYQPRKGRLPGAILIPFQAMFSFDRKYITREQYKAMLPTSAGESTAGESTAGEKTLLTYCEVGVRAATVALLHEIYLQQIVAVYDGSLMEWALDQTRPLSSGRVAQSGV